jgi:succinyl-diaminopimelate desuccinylase
MDIAGRLLQLLEIPSVTGDEAALCEFLARELSAASNYAMERVGNSLAFYPRARTQQLLVALAGHIDTVPPAAVNRPRREGDRIFGCGASDMKSGLALMWRLMVDAPIVDPAYDLAFIFYDGEEGPYEGSGLGPLLERVNWLSEIALAFCLEPSDNVLQLGCMGTLHADVLIKGRAAHSARPWQGENAIYKAIPLLAELAALEPEEVRFGELIYREVLSATLAQAGTARNVIPDRMLLNLNYRFAPGRSLALAQERVRDLVGGRGEVSFVDLSPSGPIPEGNAVLDDFLRKCTVTVQPKQAWTDVARLAQAGIPAVNFGPGEGAKAHQPDESTSIALLEQGERLFRTFLARR